MNEKHATFPSAVEAFILVALLWCLEYLLALAFSEAQGLLGVSDWFSLWGMSTLLANALLFTGLMQWKNLRYRELFNASRSSSTATFFLLVPPVLLATPLLLLAMTALEALVQAAFPMSSQMEEQMGQLVAADVPQFVLVCLLAPVLEEMLFRGIILRSFLQQYERGYAILGSAVIFGFAHGNIYQLPVAVVTGVALGWLYERSRSLIPCIALHMAFNGGAMLLAAFADGDAPGLALWWLALPALPACYVLRRFLAAPAR